jgi:hypothetical protein
MQKQIHIVQVYLQQIKQAAESLRAQQAGEP